MDHAKGSAEEAKATGEKVWKDAVAKAEEKMKRGARKPRVNCRERVRISTYTVTCQGPKFYNKG